MSMFEFDTADRKGIRTLAVKAVKKRVAYSQLADRLRSYTSTASSTTVSGNVDVVGADSSGGAITVTLDSGLVSEGAVITVTDVGGAAGTNAITVDSGGTASIDGGTSTSIASNYGEVRLVSDGTNWFTA